MKIYLIILLALFQGCEPGLVEYGYHWNPQNILYIAHQAVKEVDAYKWYEVSSDYAYCKYGTPDALAHLKEITPSKMEDIDNVIVKRRVLPADANSAVGFKAETKEILDINLINKKTKNNFMKVTITCLKGESRAFCKLNNLTIVGAKEFLGNEVCENLKP